MQPVLQRWTICAVLLMTGAAARADYAPFQGYVEMPQTLAPMIMGNLASENLRLINEQHAGKAGPSAAASRTTLAAGPSTAATTARTLAAPKRARDAPMAKLGTFMAVTREQHKRPTPTEQGSRKYRDSAPR